MSKLNNNKKIMRGDVYFRANKRPTLFKRTFYYFDVKNVVSGFRIVISK